MRKDRPPLGLGVSKLPMPSLLRRLSSAVPPGSTPGYWLFAGHVVTVFGIALSNALMGLMAIWALVNRRSIEWSFRPYAKLFLPVSLYSIFFIVSALTSLDRSISFSGLRDLLSFATLFLAPFLVSGEREVRRIVDLIITMTCCVALVGIGQYFLTGYGGLHHRIVGPFSHYQTFAGILLIGALVVVARISSGDGWRRPISWLALGVILWTLLLTLTRGAWVAMAVALLVLVLIRARWAVLGGIALVALCAALLGPASWTERVKSIVDLSDQSNYDRLCMLDAGLFMIDERPLFGIGLEMVEERYPIYRHPTAPQVHVPHLHNSFLQRAAEQGLVGLAAYLVMMGVALFLGLRGLRREGVDGPRGDLYLALVLVIVAFNVASLFEDNWRDTEVRRLLLFYFAIPLCLQGSRDSSLQGSEGSDESEDETGRSSDPGQSDEAAGTPSATAPAGGPV